MKKYIFTILVGFALNINAQQMQLSSQYMFNDFVINPAVAGTKDASFLSLSFRRQWVGMDEAPICQTLSGHTYLGKNVGVGGLVFNESYGPTRITGFGAALSYMFQVSKKTKLSFGINPTFTQFTVNRNRLITEIPGDNTVLNSAQNGLAPDVNIGALWFNDDFNLGVTGFNLIESKKDLYDVGKPITNKVNRAIYINGGYRFKVAEKFAIKPSVLYRLMFNAPSQLDGNVQFIYNNNYWLGISYRSGDATSILLGMRFNRIMVGYSYDYTLTKLSTYNSGTHEIFLSLKLFDNKNKSPWQKRNRIYSPSID
jgi:type IX secretion system PorP/SprF family membrane protein